MADGYVLNDAMNLFAAAPRPGESVPNRMEPRKRPTSGMAPVIVLDREGNVVAAGFTESLKSSVPTSCVALPSSCCEYGTRMLMRRFEKWKGSEGTRSRLSA